MNPTDLFTWGVLCCNCLCFLFLGLVLVLWVLSPRVEGSYTERPQRTRADHPRPVDSAGARQEPARSSRWSQRTPPAAVRPPETRHGGSPTPAAPAAARKSPRPVSAPAAPPLDTAALSAALADAQRAAEAIDDLRIEFPAIPQYDFEVPPPVAPEIAIGTTPLVPAAETAPVAQVEPAVAPLATSVRAAIQQVAERVEQAAPVARPATQRVKAAAQQAPSPLAAPTLAQGMEAILQDLIRREAEPLRHALHVESTPEGGVKIIVGDRIYFSVAEMPEGRPKRLLQQAVKQWNELWQSQSPSPKR